jgi:hypothetical protein
MNVVSIGPDLNSSRFQLENGFETGIQRSVDPRIVDLLRLRLYADLRTIFFMSNRSLIYWSLRRQGDLWRWTQRRTMQESR